MKAWARESCEMKNEEWCGWEDSGKRFPSLWICWKNGNGLFPREWLSTGERLAMGKLARPSSRIFENLIIPSIRTILGSFFLPDALSRGRLWSPFILRLITVLILVQVTGLRIWLLWLRWVDCCRCKFLRMRGCSDWLDWDYKFRLFGVVLYCCLLLRLRRILVRIEIFRATLF